MGCANISGSQIRQQMSEFDMIMRGQTEVRVQEAAGSMAPHLAKIIASLEAAEHRLLDLLQNQAIEPEDPYGNPSKAAGNTVSPSEIKQMHRIEDTVKRIQKLLDQGIE